jgi:hypothetical protein
VCASCRHNLTEAHILPNKQFSDCKHAATKPCLQNWHVCQPKCSLPYFRFIPNDCLKIQFQTRHSRIIFIKNMDIYLASDGQWNVCYNNEFLVTFYVTNYYTELYYFLKHPVNQEQQYRTLLILLFLVNRICIFFLDVSVVHYRIKYLTIVKIIINQDFENIWYIYICVLCDCWN